MIFITGDTHGDAMHRLNMYAFPEQKTINTGEENFIIICGDFGCVWSGSRAEDYQLDWLNDKPFKTLSWMAIMKITIYSKHIRLKNGMAVEYTSFAPMLYILCAVKSMRLKGKRFLHSVEQEVTTSEMGS